MKSRITTISEIKIKFEHKVPLRNRPKIESCGDAYSYFLQYFELENLTIKEEAVALYLNRANRVIGAYKISSGGISSTIVDIRLILATGLKCLASGIILAHNHPSGEVIPSKADLELTSKLKEAAKLMDVNLLDHLIITPSHYYSFADHGEI